MAKPSTAFPRSYTPNVIFRSERPDIGDLPTWYGQNDEGETIIISSWRFTPEEVIEVAKTGHVFIEVMGESLPPIYVATGLDFDEVKDADDQID